MSNKFSTLIGTSVLAIGLLAVSTTNATAMGMGGGGGQMLVTCDVTDLIPTADGCDGAFPGNDTGAMGTALTNLNTGIFNGMTGWLLADKSDDPSSIAGFSIVDNSNGANSGTLTLTLDYATPIAISLKASNGYSLYYYENPTDLTIDFDTCGVQQNQNGQCAGLSHASLFVKDGTAIPEPLTMLGVGTAVGFGTFFKKRLAKTKKR